MVGTPCLKGLSGTRRQHLGRFFCSRWHLQCQLEWRPSVVGLSLPLSVGNLQFSVNYHFFLAVMTIVLHQSVGMPMGAGAMMRLSMFFQRACFTDSLKWKGTGIGLNLALGTALL